MSAAGSVVGVNGNLVTAERRAPVRQHEVAWVVRDGLRLMSEVVRVRGERADLQVFESTAGLRAGDPVEFSGEMLSVELGPGLLGSLYDGLQNPLWRRAASEGPFLARGVRLPALDPGRRWPFTPLARAGDGVEAGDALGTVPEGRFAHDVMVPFGLRGRWRVREIVPAGELGVLDPVAVLEDAGGARHEVGLSFRWPIRRAVRLYRERLAPSEPLLTQIRILDTLFPVALGGTYCMPGPFGSGKTVLQQITSRHALIDLVVIAACGERAGEVVETIRDFPALPDPQTDRPLLERTIIVCNTSSMPIAAREASVYTAVTMAEYYRQMGLNVLLLADSTSRWAQAMRERSGRLEEIPGEEAFPAYLESTIAEFYERAGRVRLRNGRIGTLTIGGTVSPAGGNFEEPVTQATLKAVGAFHALSRERSDQRRFPAIDPLESWSRYRGIIDPERRERVRRLLSRAHEIAQMMKVVGEEGTTTADFALHLAAEFFDAVYLQQNAFDPVDAATPRARQEAVFSLLLELLESDLRFDKRDEARAFFDRLRQRCLDWNAQPWGGAECEATRRDIEEMWKSQRADRARPRPLRRALVESDLDSSFRRSPRRDHKPGDSFGADDDEADDR